LAPTSLLIDDEPVIASVPMEIDDESDSGSSEKGDDSAPSGDSAEWAAAARAPAFADDLPLQWPSSDRDHADSL
jgi:hypothetical protein